MPAENLKKGGTHGDGKGKEKDGTVRLIRDNPFGALYFSWSQLFRVSRRLLEALSAFIRRNSSFYYEFLLPTLAYNGGFTVRQFENYGYRFEVSWGLRSCTNRSTCTTADRTRSTIPSRILG